MASSELTPTEALQRVVDFIDYVEASEKPDDDNFAAVGEAVEVLRSVVGREVGGGVVPAPAVPMEGEPGPSVLLGAALASMPRCEHSYCDLVGVVVDDEGDVWCEEHRGCAHLSGDITARLESASVQYRRGFLLGRTQRVLDGDPCEMTIAARVDSLERCMDRAATEIHALRNRLDSVNTSSKKEPHTHCTACGGPFTLGAPVQVDRPDLHAWCSDKDQPAEDGDEVVDVTILEEAIGEHSKWNILRIRGEWATYREYDGAHGRGATVLDAVRAANADAKERASMRAQPVESTEAGS